MKKYHWPFHQAVNRQDILNFFIQLSTLISAGISLMKSLDIITQAHDKTSFKFLIQALKIDLESGRPLNQCLGRHRRYFDTFSCHLVHIGEQTGTLDIMIKRIIHYKEKSRALAKTFKQALFYPAMIVLAAVATTSILLIFVVPQFAALFEHFPNKIPLATHLLFQLSFGLRAAGPWILAVIGILVFAFLGARKSTTAKHWQRLLLRLPLLGQTLMKISLANFTRNLATMLSAGSSLNEALIMTSQLSPFDLLTQGILQARHGVNAGKYFYSTLELNPLFPSLLVQMTRTGEESGSLDSMLDKFADIYEAELEQTLSAFRLLLEPLIIAILGVLIGGVVITLYLPIFRLGTAI